MLDIDKYFEEVSHKIHEMSDEEFENLLIKCDLINENFQVDDIVYFKRGLAPEGYENKQLKIEECLKTKLKLKGIKPHYWSKYLLTKDNDIKEMNNIIRLNEKDSKQFNKAMKESKLNKDIISKGILLLKKLTSEKERLNMDCNIHCYWNYNGQCCPESKEEIEQALPNNKKCPTYLVPNFEKDLKNILDECKILLHFRNYEQLKEIRNFVQNQSKEYIDILYQIEDYIINTKQLRGFYLEHIIKKFNISETITTDIINYYINKGLLEEQIEVRCPNCNNVVGYQNDKKLLNDTIKGNCFCDNCEELITTMDFMENTKNYYKVIRK